MAPETATRGHIERDDTSRVYRIRGEVDPFTGGGFAEMIDEALPSDVVLDLSEVTSIDGSGLRALLAGVINKVTDPRHPFMRPA